MLLGRAWKHWQGWRQSRGELSRPPQGYIALLAPQKCIYRPAQNESSALNYPARSEWPTNVQFIKWLQSPGGLGSYFWKPLPRILTAYSFTFNQRWYFSQKQLQEEVWGSGSRSAGLRSTSFPFAARTSSGRPAQVPESSAAIRFGELQKSLSESVIRR